MPLRTDHVQAARGDNLLVFRRRLLFELGQELGVQLLVLLGVIDRIDATLAQWVARNRVAAQDDVGAAPPVGRDRDRAFRTARAMIAASLVLLAFSTSCWTTAFFRS